MNNYQPNSHRSKEQNSEEKRVTKVVKGPVRTKQKTELRKFADVFISEDVKNVKSYVVMDVLVPAIKKAVVDIISDGAHMIFYGGSSRRGTRDSRGDKISYVDYSRHSYDDRRPSSNNVATRTDYNSDQFVFATRGDAEEVLAQMDATVEKYGMVRVLDLFDMLGKTCDHTANKYGWTSTRNATIERVRDGGYVIKMPRALPLD